MKREIKRSKVRRNQKWSSEKVVSEIQTCSNASAKNVQRIYPALYGAAVRCFGSWRKAAEASGLEYGSVARKKDSGYWSKEQILDEIRRLKVRSSSHVRGTRPDLYSAALRELDSWKNAVEEAGFNYEDAVFKNSRSKKRRA